MKPSGDRFSGEVQTWPSLLPTLRRREQREGVPCCYGGEDGMATSGSPGEMGRWRKPEAAKGKSGYGGWTNRHPFLG